MTINVHIADNPETIQQFVRAAQTNMTQPPFQPAGLCIYEQDELIAGVCGQLTPHWLYVDVLWVHEDQRGQQLGRRLMTAIEQTAVARRINAAFLGTAEFQARSFYERSGYRIIGEYTVAGVKTYIMCKALAPVSNIDNTYEIQVPLDGEVYGLLQAKLNEFNAQFVELPDPQQVFIVAQNDQGQIVGGIQAGLMPQDAVIGLAWCGADNGITGELLASLETHVDGRQIMFRTDDVRWISTLRDRIYSEVFALENFPNDKTTRTFVKIPSAG